MPTSSDELSTLIDHECDLTSFLGEHTPFQAMPTESNSPSWRPDRR